MNIQIYAISLTGKVISLDVETDDTIYSLSLKIQDREGIPVGQIRFVYDGRKLDDESKTLADYNIPDQAVLYKLLKLS